MDVLAWSWIFTDWKFLLSITLLLLYLIGTKNNNYFSERNVPYIDPGWFPFLGSGWRMAFRMESITDFAQSLYDGLKGHPYGGVINYMIPVVVIRDPELIKAVTVKDFDHFTDHVSVVTEEKDPMWGKGLFNLQGQRWKDMRSTLSPAFTSSKMKMMFVLIDECGKQLVEFLEKCSKDFTPDKVCKVEKGAGQLSVEMKDLFTRYTNDVIATTAFGVSVNSLMKPSNEFYLMGKEVTNFGGTFAIKWIGFLLSPKIMKMLNFTVMSQRVTNFFRSLVYDTMTTREREGITRPDMIHLLMLAKKGALQDENSPQNGKTILKDDDIAAQAFFFFLAGFDTTATLLSFVTYELAVHPNIQCRLQEEIEVTLQKCGGSITYDAIKEMKYLDMVISETLRLHPQVVGVDRMCVKPYTLPSEPPLEIKCGDMLWIPLYPIQRDPEYFPDPEKFDPERFSDENKHNIKPFTYLPFGTGPRSCIGNRFALMEGKIALVHLLSRFNLKVISKTPIPLKISKKGFNMVVDGGVWLGLEPRQTVIENLK